MSINVVIFTPAGSYGPESLPALGGDDVVTVVTWHDVAPEGDQHIGVPQGRLGAKIVSAAGGNVLARTIVRFLPTDTGARFWRATRGSTQVWDAVRTAHLIVAPERDGGFAAWSWLRVAARHGRKIRAVSGYPAARTAIEQLR